MKNVLITGVNGFLGQHLLKFLSTDGYNITGTGRGESRLHPGNNSNYVQANLTDAKEVDKLLNECQPDVIIHNAAMSKPDECNVERNECLAINVESTRMLLQKKPAHFIYISTDFVFGENGPHAEGDKTGPLNFYGESKLLAEHLVMDSGVTATIVRPVFIYGQVYDGMRPTFLHWVKNNLVQEKPIKVVSDQLRTPTYAPDICKGISTIIHKKATGIFHLAGKDIVSPYQMAVTTARQLHLDETLITSVTADTFPEPVQRAKRSGLVIDKAKKELQYEPVSFAEGVKLTFNL